MIIRATLAAIGMSAMLSACQSLTPQQTGALICVLSSDGATVAAVYKPDLAPKAGALSTVACDAGTQVGAIIGGKK